jgi:hypothetical protein
MGEHLIRPSSPPIIDTNPLEDSGTPSNFSGECPFGIIPPFIVFAHHDDYHRNTTICCVSHSNPISLLENRPNLRQVYDPIAWTSPLVVPPCFIFPCEYSFDDYQNRQSRLFRDFSYNTQPSPPHFHTTHEDEELFKARFFWNSDAPYQSFPSLHEHSSVSVNSQGTIELPLPLPETYGAPYLGDLENLNNLDECEDNTTFFNESGHSPFDELFAQPDPLSNSVIPMPSHTPLSSTCDFESAMNLYQSPSQTPQTKSVPLEATNSKNRKRSQTQKGKQQIRKKREIMLCIVSK